MRQPAPPLALAARGWLRIPASQCRSVSGPVPGCAKVDIAAEDWDMLFRAALELLARVATAPDLPANEFDPQQLHPMHSQHPLQTREAAIRDCLDALDHLRRSVPLRCSAASAPQETSPST